MRSFFARVVDIENAHVAPFKFHAKPPHAHDRLAVGLILFLGVIIATTTTSE